MRAFTITTLMVIGSIASPFPTRAQNADVPSTAGVSRLPGVQVTPFVSTDSQGSMPVGATVTFPLGSNISFETEVDYRRMGAMNLLNSSANLLYDLPRVGRTTPYLATGAGLADTIEPIASPDGLLAGVQRRVAFEVNAGGGIKVPVNDSLGMRTDARWYKSFGRGGSEHWRLSHGVSFDVGRR